MSFVTTPMKTVTATPTISAGAYAAADLVGTIQTLAVGGEHVTLKTLTCLDKGDQAAELKVHFFSSLPTIASADNAKLDITDAEAEKYVGTVVVGNTAYDMDATNNQSASETGLSLDIDTTDGNVYAIVQAVGTPTYGSTSALVFKYAFTVNHAV